ncbi:S1 family peptidase [Kribbella endophytica]
MAEQGRSDLPRPPRRIPGWAVENGDPPPALGPRTTIEPRRRAPENDGPGEPLPPKFRPRFVVPLVVFVLVLGAAAGWLVRAYSLSLDADDVRASLGPAVVRVLATTCDGTGQASGVLLPGGTVLTATSAILSPVSVAILTQDGRVRRATVRGSTADGVAVLTVAGPANLPTAQFAQKLPDVSADRGLVGYDLSGEQVVVQAGTTKQPATLPGLVDAGALGAPLSDREGRVIGLFTGDTVATGKIIGKDRLPSGPNPSLRPETTEPCSSRGPQSPVEPDLAVANTPLAGEVNAALADYLNTLNLHNFVAMQSTYSERLRSLSSAKVDESKHGTSYAFGAVIEKVRAAGAAADAEMAFTVLFSPTSAQAKGQTCAQLRIQYHLVREQQKLRIDGAKTVGNKSGCGTD